MNSAKTCFFQMLNRAVLMLLLILPGAPLVAQVNSNAVLDAAKGYVVVPHAAPLDLAPKLTIELWLRPGPATASYGAVVDKDYTTGFSFGVSSISGRTDSVNVAVIAGGIFYGPRIASDDLTWTHLAVSIDTVAHQVVFYQNGTLTNTVSVDGVRFENNAADVRLGRSAFGDGFVGACDEVRIWTGIRSEAEIGSLWNHEAKGNELGLVAAYHFEDIRDTVAWNRASSGGLHGTFSAQQCIVAVQWPMAFLNEHEPNGSFANATPVSHQRFVLEASIAPADTDHYKIWTWPGDLVRIESAAKNAGESADLLISFFGPDSILHITTHGGGYPGFYTAASVPGYHFIQVVNRSGTGGAYTLRSYFPGWTIEADEFEPNNSLAQATPRPWGETGIASLFPGIDAGVVAPDTDYYAYTAQAGEIGFFPYSIEGVGCGSGIVSMHSATETLTKTFPSYYQNYRFPTAGTYYLRICPNEATYDYYWGGFKGLEDIHHMLYDPAAVGTGVQICTGMNGAYSNGYMLKIDNTWFTAKPDYSATELDGRQFLFGPQTLAGLSVVRKFFVPTAAQGDTLGYMRIQDILTNPTASAISVRVSVLSDLGYNTTRTIATSSGDSIFTRDDRWLWTDDDAPSGNKPNILHIFDGVGGADRVDSVSFAQDELYWEWRDVTVGPGETRIYLYYVAQDTFPENALKKGPAFSGSELPGGANFGLGADAASVMNWATGALVSVGGADLEPLEYNLEQNYPNPFNPVTTIRYSVGRNANAAGWHGSRWVKLTVYDLLGREVAVLVDEQKAPGTYEVKFDATSLSSGMYVYHMHSGAYAQVRKLLVLK